MYPKTPRRPNPDPEAPGETLQVVSTPASPSTPQAVGGAPKLNRHIPRARGLSGPERWDKAQRDIFPAETAARVPSVIPHRIDVEGMMGDQRQAIERLDALLEEKLKGLPAGLAEQDPFWQKFTSLRKGFAAEFLADVVGLLSEQPDESTPMLDTDQTAWLQDHPLTRWMNWWKPGGADMIE